MEYELYSRGCNDLPRRKVHVQLERCSRIGEGSEEPAAYRGEPEGVEVARECLLDAYQCGENGGGIQQGRWFKGVFQEAPVVMYAFKGAYVRGRVLVWIISHARWETNQ